MMLPQVNVTGMGIVSAIGKNICEFEHSLRKGICGIGRLSNKSIPSESVNIGAEIKDFSFEFLLNGFNTNLLDFTQKAKKCASRSPYVIQTSVISTIEAWNHAQLFEKQVDSARVGIIVAGNNLTQHYQYELRGKFDYTPEYLSPRYPLHFMDTDHVGTLSEILNIHGEGFTVGGASASGNMAIIQGARLIQSGTVDVCLVIGALADLSPMELQGFYNIGAMGGKRFYDYPEEACRPFDRDHEGFIYGQASGCMVLESDESAKKRDVRALAEISGGAIVLAGNRLSDPDEESEVRAMKGALAMAQLRADQVAYINAHGTSSPLGDETEIKAIKSVFEQSTANVWINSTKGLTGHCLYSAGIVECIAVIIQMQEGFLHANNNLVNPIDDECRFCPGESIPIHLDTAMNNSFGFGGINTSLIVKKGE